MPRQEVNTHHGEIGRRGIRSIPGSSGRRMFTASLAMSALGQKRTSHQVRVMSALPPKADIRCGDRQVRFVPKADIRRLIRSPHRQVAEQVMRLASVAGFQPADPIVLAIALRPVFVL